MEMTTEQKKFFDAMLERAKGGESFDDVIASVVAEKLEGVDQIPAIKGAVEQLENERVKQVEEENQDLKKRVDRLQRQTYSPYGQRYRGLFPSEDAARTYGLFIQGHVNGQKWCQEALKSDHKDVYDEVTGSKHSKAFTTTNADAVIPETWITTMINNLEDYGVFEPNARRIPMPSDLVHYSKKTGRTSAAPMAEGGSQSETKPTVTGRDLTARKWGAYTEVNSEVEEDSIIPIAEFIMDDMTEAHAEAVDDAGFNGDGTATYNQITGVLNALGTGAIVQMATGNTSWADFTLDHFTKAISLAKRKTFRGDPKWYCTHQFYWQVMVPLVLAKGGVTAGEVEGRRRLLFLGYPVEMAQVLATSEAAGQIPAVFGSLRQGAAFGDRRRLEIKASEHFKFSSDQTAMLSTRRFDIDINSPGDASNAEVLTAVQTAAS